MNKEVIMGIGDWGLGIYHQKIKWGIINEKKKKNMKIRRLKNLEMVLENINRHPNPKVELEQYSTPANIAADLMWNGYILGDIKGRNIIDLGCGTGIFSISSLLLDANNVLAIDIKDLFI